MGNDSADKPKDRFEERRILDRSCGVAWDLEEEADRILAEYRRQHPIISEEEYLVLSKGQMDRRAQKEILNKQSFPEAHLYSGLYRRAYNPNIGKRPRSGTTNKEQDFD